MSENYGSQRKQMLAAFARVNACERVLIGPLVRRQLRVDPRFDKYVTYFGIDGTLMLYRARAMGVWIFVLATATILSSALRLGLVIAGVIVVTVIVGAIGLAYNASAQRLGRQWRATIDAPDD